jgi:hypothetical protein
MTALEKKAAQKREIKKFKREEMRLRHKAKKQHRCAAASPSTAPFHGHDGEVAPPWMPSSSESGSFTGAAPDSVPGLPGGSGGYVPSDVDVLPDRSSSSSSSTLMTRARAARCGGVGSSKARRSPFPVPRQVRSGPSPRTSKRTDPKGGVRAVPYLGCVRSALSGNSTGQCFDAPGSSRCWLCRSGHRCDPWKNCLYIAL